MKLREEYQNYLEALMFVIGDKRPYCVSNDKAKFAYQIPLKNYKRGFDFYELNRAQDGGVFFTIVTMVGFKTICETNSNHHYNDIAVTGWQKIIFDITFKHFSKEEYLALKMGYIKKGQATFKPASPLKPEEIDLEYLKNKPQEEWSKVEKLMKSSDDFLKLSLEMSQKKKSGCVLLLLPIIVLISITLCL